MEYENESVGQRAKVRVRQKKSKLRKKIYSDMDWENKVSAIQRARYGEPEGEHLEEDPILAEEWLEIFGTNTEYQNDY